MEPANTSGQGKLAAVPTEVRGWNWGAFGLNWIWGLFNGTYIALLAFIPIVNFVIILILGIKGSEWAWQNKKWESVEHFKRVQRKWAYAFLIVLITAVLLYASSFYFLYQATKPPVASADLFFQELASGQIDAAYDSTGQDFQTNSTREDFKNLLEQLPFLTQVESESFPSREINWGNGTALLTGTLTGADGQTLSMQVVEEKEDGQWKVAGLHTNPTQ